MVQRKSIELWVGIFMIAGVLAMLLLALRVSGLSEIGAPQGYVLNADFDNIGSLKVRAPVTLAGVKVGEVSRIQLDPKTFKAVVTLRIHPKDKNLPIDTSASILTAGLLGANYINLTPGYDEHYLQAGDTIDNTHSALILENLIGQLVFALKDDKK